jgi:aldehyde:ferredoxin oxidoreductase
VNENRWGVHRKLLRVDLTQGRVWVQNLPSSFSESGVGGRGLGTRLLLEEGSGTDDALSPESKIVLSTGLLTGTGSPTGAWMTLMARSPLTGLLASSPVGGHFPVRLKLAGYDAVMIEGRADEPTSLVIGEETRLLPSGFLRDKTVGETNDYFISHWGNKMQVLCIGPAGERGYKTATPVMDRSRSGTCPGLGAVMGSKNLKAIAACGDRLLPVAAPEKAREVSSATLRKIANEFITLRELSAYGSARFLHAFDKNGTLPTRNFLSGRFEELRRVDGEAIYDTLVSRRIACFNCPIGCRRLSRLDDLTPYVEGPDFIDVVSFGSLCGNHDLQTILKARHCCHELGIDPLSMGAAIASAMHLFECGSISEKEAGFPLNFGNPSAILHLLDQAKKNEGLGRLLAEDPSQVGANHGFPESLYQIRRQPVGPSHPRYDAQMDLHYRVSTSGTWYLLGAGPSAEQIKIYDQLNAKDDVSRVRVFQNVMAVIESLGLCEYLLLFLDLNDLSALLPPILGIHLDMHALLQLGEKMINEERRLNLEWDRDQNLLSQNPSWSSEIPNEKVVQYFSLRNWDERGVPRGK